MPETMITQDSLVLYKHHPARVKRVGDKLEVELETGKHLKIRLKDATPLHPGPIHSLGELTAQQGEVETAWELLMGEAIDLADLADLIYGVYTPATAWATWQLVADDLYFRGDPKEIRARSAEAVAKEKATREAKVAQQQAWASFLDRIEAGQAIPEDSRYLREVERLALDQQPGSRVLRHLKRTETPENAHALLLELNYWDNTQNPYPTRLGLTISSPQPPLPALPAEERVDLTHLLAYAIDDEGSQDPDDALSLDGDRLWVHVADVAALVSSDAEADHEARARGANLYLPEGTVHMLPPAATRILALGLNDVSPALSFGLDMDRQGQIAHLEIVSSWIKVQRLTYKKAETLLDTEPFRSLYHIAVMNQTRRQENGSIFIDLPEVKVRVEEGRVNIRPLPALKSRDLVQEAMLLCGEAVASFARKNDIPIPFSTQDSPESKTISDGLAGMFAMRRAMKRSQLSTTPGPHAGLGLDNYVRITSPLRRYLDLVAHQQIRNYLRGDALLSVRDIVARIGAVEALGGLRRAERLSNKHWTLVYLLQHPEWSGDGVVVEQQGRRAVVLIPSLNLEIRTYLPENLPLNSVVRLSASRVNLPEQDVHFRVSS